ncbi:hypothetical protein LRQ11_09735 [Pseudomonas sp. MAFF 311095]|uniref:Uncharacterized protein n=1 Tax=Pseudomonas petroselini TaxID=2899822 RepID=A0ABS8QNY6_9PSED|nr:hypothetical protein [Pseudomonas petroselini]MCD7037364.1 hypothetical protein [Pseudomonas petroselini]MCD7044265.1 hypothetical protein [Pseudomonas petroselini]MCD7069367.1 hypothetical protein [Pseudomonas petroselini]MCD7079135.1 hypothetical protein [Pseudomonas petroselini]
MVNTQYGQNYPLSFNRPDLDGQPTSREDKYKHTSNLDLVKTFGNNFDYFVNTKTGFVDQAKLREVAARPLTGNSVNDNMTLLAGEILNRPDVNRKLDKLNERGIHDGLVDRENVEQLVDYYTSDDASAGQQSRAGEPSTAPSFSQAYPAQYERPVNNVGAFNPPAMNHSPGDYRAPSNTTVARDFADSFSYFQGPSGFVTRAVLEDAANRPLTGHPVHDRMTMLANEILSRPEMSHLLDAINHGGREDGLISQGDANRVVDYYQTQEAPSMQSGAGRYTGSMQRQRVENTYDENYRPQAFGTNAPIQPLSWGMSASSQGEGMSPQNTEVAYAFKGTKDSDLASELGNNFDYFKPDANGKITQGALREVAGQPLTGNASDDRMTLLAREIISRPGLNSKLDSDHDADKSDGIIGRDTIERVSRQTAAPSYEKMSDVELLQALDEKFKQYWGADNYISFDSLKSAAAESPPTDRSGLAAELLRRPGLMKEVDIGTDGKGGRGAEDERFNWVNVDYVRGEKQAQALRG